jgi:glycosyltransferase involved in cell wall biosynthesis
MVALSRELGQKEVRFLGHVDHFDDLPELYNAADVLVVPSKGEPFGLVAIEALAYQGPFQGRERLEDAQGGSE